MKFEEGKAKFEEGKEKFGEGKLKLEEGKEKLGAHLSKTRSAPKKNWERTRLKFAFLKKTTQRRTEPYTKQRSFPLPCRVQCIVLCRVCVGFEA